MNEVIGFEYAGQPASLEVADGSLKRVVATLGGFSACLASVSGEFRQAAESILEVEGLVPTVGSVVEWADRGFVGFGYRATVVKKSIVGGDVDYTVEVTDVLNSEGVVVPVEGKIEMVIGYSDLFLHKQAGVVLFPELEEVAEEDGAPKVDAKADKKRKPKPEPVVEPKDDDKQESTEQDGGQEE